ncbi:uncharacterized protein Z520_12284 [Fonsecaea multimorphosa CBS 102226]|uniref:Protein kinase domain-containing protein n=1 Tax=Fonsecaea multimorphosa CBS 102226 TaxID=1442371 RepID=A0A0D2K6L4_9EURO|nr:uncharacterized protein Z520_12284 [Fonsecaea multimorphosa CBS 102226]KIX92013.1 hypothetical protein Z520_12284 [Fonsecaea multimorphosa CBS 102226]
MVNGRRLITAKIADLGTTKYDLSGNMQTYTGSGVYVASEFWEPKLHHTNAVDIWSFGIIMLELLTHQGTRLKGWDARLPPSPGCAPELDTSEPAAAYRTLIKGFQSPIKGWTAGQIEKWLKENVQADAGTSRKRGASSLREMGDDEEDRSLRGDYTAVSKPCANHGASPTSGLPDTVLLDLPSPGMKTPVARV